MQWIFDEASAHASALGAAALFADAVVSLLRQWIVRYGTWKIAAGFLGGILHIWLVFACLMLRPPMPKIQDPPEETCGNSILGCVALEQKRDRTCLSCETSPNSIPAYPR